MLTCSLETNGSRPLSAIIPAGYAIHGDEPREDNAENDTGNGTDQHSAKGIEKGKDKQHNGGQSEHYDEQASAQRFPVSTSEYCRGAAES
jgi:hypothetical protein